MRRGSSTQSQKWFRILLCSVVLAALLGHVGSAETITIMTWKDTENYQGYFRAFTEATGIEVQLAHQNWGSLDQLVTTVAGGVPPDLVLLDSRWLSEAASQGLVRDIAPLVAGDPAFDWSEFYPAIMEGVGFGSGAVYGVCTAFDMYHIWYNQGHLDRVGATIPENWTYDDYLAVARRMTNPDPNNPVWGSNWMNWYWPAMAAGGELITADGRFGMNDPEVVEAMQFAYDLINVHHVVPTWTELTLGFQARFPAEKTSMHWAGPWYLTSYVQQTSIDWGIAVPPRWKDKGSATELFVLAWAIPTGEADVDLALKFLRWALSLEGAIAEGKAEPLLSTRRSMISNPDLPIWETFGEFSSVLMDTVLVAKPSPFHPKTREVRGIIDQAMLAVDAGQKSARQALDEVLAQIEAALQ